MTSYQSTRYLNLIKQSYTYIEEKVLLTLWEIIGKDTCDNESVRGEKYRKGMVRVGSHVAPEPDYIQYIMDQLFQFMKLYTVDATLSSGIIHFFVYTHPFCDGNGRTARLLATDYLIRNGYENFRAISISKYLSENRFDYYAAISNSKNRINDITPFLSFYIFAIYNTLASLS